MADMRQKMKLEELKTLIWRYFIIYQNTQRNMLSYWRSAPNSQEKTVL